MELKNIGILGGKPESKSQNDMGWGEPQVLNQKNTKLFFKCTSLPAINSRMSQKTIQIHVLVAVLICMSRNTKLSEVIIFTASINNQNAQAEHKDFH